MKDLYTLFNQNTPEAPEDLTIKIFNHIVSLAEARTSKFKIFWAALAITSLTVCVMGIVDAVKEIGVSHFSTYLSIIFSDISSVGSIWKELGLSLVEALPIVSFGVILAGIAVTLFAVRRLFKNGTPFAAQTFFSISA